MPGEVESANSLVTNSATPLRDIRVSDNDVSLIHFNDGRVGKATSCIDCLQPSYFHMYLVGSEGVLLDNRSYSTRLGDQKKIAGATSTFRSSIPAT
jgi:hypothetical protein